MSLPKSWARSLERRQRIDVWVECLLFALPEFFRPVPRKADLMCNHLCDTFILGFCFCMASRDTGCRPQRRRVRIFLWLLLVPAVWLYPCTKARLIDVFISGCYSLCSAQVTALLLLSPKQLHHPLLLCLNPAHTFLYTPLVKLASLIQCALLSYETLTWKMGSER